MDVGDNYSIIELSSNNFVYEEIDATNPDREDANHVSYAAVQSQKTVSAYL